MDGEIGKHLVCEDSFCVWIDGEDDMISVCVCLSVYFFSGEISQNIGPQKYKGSLYSVSWGWRFLPWELQGPWSTPLAMHSSSVTCPCNSPGRMPSPVADIFFVYLQGTSLHENFERWDILENKNLHVNACSSLW